jgi:hypothetical protein
MIDLSVPFPIKRDDFMDSLAKALDIDPDTSKY